MADEPEFDPRAFFETLRKSASVKMGAVVFGEAQVAYYEILKQHMSEDEAFNMLAHTTECVIKGVASSVGPLAEVLLRASVIWERLAGVEQQGGKEVPGA